MMNVIAILVTALIAFLIGMLWYSPLFFGNVFMRLAKKRIGTPKPNPSTFVLSFFSGLLFTTILAYVINISGISTFIGGMLIGLLIWVGFIATTMLDAVLWDNMPFQLYFLNASYRLVMLLVCGGILAVWI